MPWYENARFGVFCFFLVGDWKFIHNIFNTAWWLSPRCLNYFQPLTYPCVVFFYTKNSKGHIINPVVRVSERKIPCPMFPWLVGRQVCPGCVGGGLCSGIRRFFLWQDTYHIPPCWESADRKGPGCRSFCHFSCWPETPSEVSFLWRLIPGRR